MGLKVYVTHGYADSLAFLSCDTHGCDRQLIVTRDRCGDEERMRLVGTGYALGQGWSERDTTWLCKSCTEDEVKA